MSAPPRGPAASGAPIGLLGGTFDPVHAGHLALAAGAQAALGLEHVVFVPAARPWQKESITAATHRLAMLERALADQPSWRVDTCELARGGASYTVDTLAHWRRRDPQASLVWILGSDQLERLPSWHRWTELLAGAHLAYTFRPGAPPPAAGPVREFVEAHRGRVEDLAQRPAGTVIGFAMEPVDCSSSAVRAWLAAGATGRAAGVLAPAVLEYILSHHLYSADHG